MPTARDQAPAALIGTSAYVLGGSTDCHCEALAATEEYTPPADDVEEADLSIAKTDVPDPIDVKCLLTYTLEVTNLGPNDAAVVTVTDALPPGTELLEAAGPGWTCSPPPAAAPVVTCTRPSLPVGTAPPIRISVWAPPTAGDVTNVATVTSTTRDPAPGNNRASETTTVMIVSANLGALDVPVLSAPSLVAFALGLLGAGWLLLRRRG